LRPGFLLINKPIGISSFGCISYLKRIIGKKIKIGHAGTLDPFASGLLIVAIGRQATRLIDSLMKMDKTYVAVGKCGELTDTLDHTGTIIATTKVIPSQEQLQKSFESFGSSYEQIPPLYSALKHEGKPLYALMRQQLVNEKDLHAIAQEKKRIVFLYDKRFIVYNPPFFTIQVTVSSGTYIRTLINDIATRSGSIATTYQLERVKIGPFFLSQAICLDAIHSQEILEQHIIPIENFIQ